MAGPRIEDENAIAFSILRQLYLQNKKNDREYSKNYRDVAYLDERAYPSVR